MTIGHIGTTTPYVDAALDWIGILLPSNLIYANVDLRHFNLLCHKFTFLNKKVKQTRNVKEGRCVTCMLQAI